MKILIAEDEALILDHLLELLKPYSDEIETAQDGLSAFEIFISNKNNFDLIISDFNMPGLNGIELRNKIHSSKKECPPFIIYTGNSEALNTIKAEGKIYAVVDKQDFKGLEDHFLEIKNSLRLSNN